MDETTGGVGLCVPGWNEVDFHINLTPRQPLGWLASDSTTPRKARARRINIKHYIVTTPFPAPASAQPTTAPSVLGWR